MGNACCTDKSMDNETVAEIGGRQILTDNDAKPTHTLLPPAVRAKMKAGPPPEFLIDMDRSTGQDLGVDVDISDGKTLLIDAVVGGLFQQWNDDNPALYVEKGYRIIDVNGISKNSQEMVRECQKMKLLKMWIKREL